MSWIRVRDLKILSIGRIRYTLDKRFTPLHEDGNDVWALKITQPRIRDSGQYECQVSHHDDIEEKMKKPVEFIVLGKNSSYFQLTFDGFHFDLKVFRGLMISQQV